MKIADFNYRLPKNLIAQRPTKPRDHSRLLVLNRESSKIIHDRFYNIENYLRKGDVVVLNNSKVIPARIYGEKETGGAVELLLSKELDNNIWECILKIKNAQVGRDIYFPKNLKAKILENKGGGIFNIKFNKNKKEFRKSLEEIGEMPLPPYIKKSTSTSKLNAKKQYQTIYADATKEGSVAAPTAGLHFTNRLIDKLKKRGVEFEFVTLHVGLGTFKPVQVDEVEDHKMHSEYAEVNKVTIQRILRAKEERRRIIACGTTSIRTLETVLPKYLNNKNEIKNFSGAINTFIYPGYKFKVVDAIITNFHLPKTTLLMLVSAFISTDQVQGVKILKKAYRKAIEKKYRFYSFGDAMLIL